jgi:hypothetical protein
VIKFADPFFHTGTREQAALVAIVSGHRGDRKRAVQTIRAEKRSGQRQKDDAPPDHRSEQKLRDFAPTTLGMQFAYVSTQIRLSLTHFF